MQDPFWGEAVVLREVRDAFGAQGGGKIEVIIGVRWGHEIQEVLKKLKDMHIRGVRATDLYVLANLTEMQVDELAKEEMVFKIWHNRDIKPMVTLSHCLSVFSDAASCHAPSFWVTLFLRQRYHFQ